METINKRDLLPIFKKSRFVEQFEGEITVPKKYVFTDFNIQNKIEINDNKTFNKVMDQLRFYMVDELSYEIYDYVIKHKPDLSNFEDFFFEELTLLKKTQKEELMKDDCDSLMHEYTKKGYLGLIRYAHEYGCSWDSNTCASAAENGHLDCLKYLHENGCNWNSSTCRNAARNGHLDCLKYAHENGCNWDDDTCCSVALYGHLDCLKYAHENGCSWNESTCSYAALYGHLECLKYAIENDCPYDKQEYMNGAKNYKHIIDYLESI